VSNGICHSALPYLQLFNLASNIFQCQTRQLITQKFIDPKYFL
jgi:hypothetical protein